jgi:hypothetical protein
MCKYFPYTPECYAIHTSYSYTVWSNYQDLGRWPGIFINTTASGKVDIFFIRSRDAGLLYIAGVQYILIFLHNIFRSVFSIFRIAETTQLSFCWIRLNEIRHSSLRNVSNGVQHIKNCKRTVHSFTIPPLILSHINIKPITELVSDKKL